MENRNGHTRVRVPVSFPDAGVRAGSPAPPGHLARRPHGCKLQTISVASVSVRVSHFSQFGSASHTRARSRGGLRPPRSARHVGDDGPQRLAAEEAAPLAQGVAGARTPRPARPAPRAPSYSLRVARSSRGTARGGPSAASPAALPALRGGPGPQAPRCPGLAPRAARPRPRRAPAAPGGPRLEFHLGQPPPPPRRGRRRARPAPPSVEDTEGLAAATDAFAGAEIEGPVKSRARPGASAPPPEGRAVLGGNHR